MAGASIVVVLFGGSTAFLVALLVQERQGPVEAFFVASALRGTFLLALAAWGVVAAMVCWRARTKDERAAMAKQGWMRVALRRHRAWYWTADLAITAYLATVLWLSVSLHGVSPMTLPWLFLGLVAALCAGYALVQIAVWLAFTRRIGRASE